LTYYQRLLADARRAIEDDRFAEFKAAKMVGWKNDEIRMTNDEGMAKPE
jgi:queuine/archaeosine tRNA-ribosyltransferase